MKEALIRQVPLFASLPPHEVQYLANTLRALEFPRDRVLFREDEYGDRFYVLTAGRVQIVKDLGTAGEHVLAERGPGEYIGELSLFRRDGLRSASVRTLEPVEVLEMTRADFDALLARQPGIAYEMVRVLALRLTSAENKTIAELRAKNRQLEEAYSALQAAQAQIVAQESLARELQVAHGIQMDMLPHDLPQPPGFSFAAKLLPMRAVGGDFYDAIPLTPNTIGIAIGDVAGHGVPAALFVAQALTLLRSEVCRVCSPAEVLQSVNRQLLRPSGHLTMATMLYGILNTATGDFLYARAGHEPPMLLDATGAVTTEPIDPGSALGAFDEPPLAERTVSLAPGRTLLLYTDGVIDARAPDGEMFGEERLHGVLEASCRLPAQAACDRVMAGIAAFAGDAAPQDDITLLCIQAL